VTTFADSHHGGEQGGIDGDAVVRPPSRRDKIEALGLLFGMLGILLYLALTIGATPPLNHKWAVAGREPGHPIRRATPGRRPIAA
jgi:hypothetical protein